MHVYFRSPPPHALATSLQPDDKPASDRYPITASLVYLTGCRTEISELGYSIYGYPSSGGVIVRDGADLVEVAYLGLDRLYPAEKRLSDQDAEDAFCDLLRKVGGKQWKSIKRSRDVSCFEWKCNPTKEELKRIFLGWPEEKKGLEGDAAQNAVSGGLLVLEYDDEGDTPEDIGRLRMAVNMQERCQLMKERFNATYYPDPALYTPLADLYRGRHINGSSEQSLVSPEMA